MLARIAEQKGVLSEFEEYFQLLHEGVPAISLLVRIFHEKRMRVIFTRYKPTTVDGSDLSDQMKARGHIFGSLSEETEFVPELKPSLSDIVVNKTCDNPFNCTSIGTLLPQLHVKYLVVCGVTCPGSVNVFALDAADRGYGVVIASDAVAGAIRGGASDLSGGLIRIRSTQAIVELIEEI
jgi:nicotinamidase-related amidase